MPEDLFIPKLGQTVEEVVLLNWLVEDGSKVDFGDPVLEVETDKAVFNVEANAKGYIHFGPHEMGKTLPVLTVVATIGKKDEAFSPSEQKTAIEKEEQPVEEPAQEVQPVVDEWVEETEIETREKTFASPRARKLAREKQVDLTRVTPTGGDGIRVVEQDVVKYLQQAAKATPVASQLAEHVGLDLHGVEGSGPKGAITRADVESAIHQKLSSPVKAYTSPSMNIKYTEIDIAESKPLRSVRKLIFDRMSTSDQLTARVTLVTEADATDLVRLREKLKSEKAEAWGFAPGYNELIGKITTKALQEFPFMNARLSEDGDSFDLLSEINLGVAVDTERGLVVPVIKSADKLDLKSFGTRFRELINNIQSGKISPEELSGGTFTITNLGNFDVDAFTPVINLPEVAILGIGRIKDQVVPYEGEIKVRKMITLSLVFDHRLIDGAPAARFLQRVKEYIEYPIMIFV
ncbi:MAG: 2-oxo acid dehydrogenase subunit E2 [Anaerolineales bacterium]